MEKIYIVTTGRYSDYHIAAVFQDYSKAKTYCDCHPFHKIEYWDFHDDLIYTPYYTVSASGRIYDKPYVYFECSSYEDAPGGYIDMNGVSFEGRDRTSLLISRRLSPGYDEEIERKKILKTFYDLAAVIKNEIADCENCDYYEKNWMSDEQWAIQKQLNDLIAVSDEENDGE